MQVIFSEMASGFLSAVLAPASMASDSYEENLTTPSSISFNYGFPIVEGELVMT